VGKFSEPVHLAQPPGSELLFVVEKPGRVVVLKDGRPQKLPYLDLRRAVKDSGVGGEQGLLSIAFPPDYQDSGLSYVAYTDRRDAMRIVEFAHANGIPVSSHEIFPASKVGVAGTGPRGVEAEGGCPAHRGVPVGGVRSTELRAGGGDGDALGIESLEQAEVVHARDHERLPNARAREPAHERFEQRRHLDPLRHSSIVINAPVDSNATLSTARAPAGRMSTPTLTSVPSVLRRRNRWSGSSRPTHT